ncbi:hypothetical protein EJ05DRAFT_501502 [Pseudovirgaria hyperparasitica]|uniref:Rhodopsin domain-containing protein n=1 Tax=Pseudovirgaria hyperparasitica TaxID=470096 RepID=A0A6A6W2Y9_9PEZI|nr:uncharacterized protein EJ05DRAFT_501502 [Pseudovirgaria hyperparasitica]KAF2756963.1 hypothetical protein EJ05DRAFT_501502 [Pseudovirgaria hyperparasitica]
MFDGTGTPAGVEQAAVCALLPLAWLTVIARFCRFWYRGKHIKSRSIGWDDFFMLLTSLLFSIYCAFMVVLIDRGGFRKRPLADTLPRTAIYVVLSEVFYILTTIFLKVSIGLFFLRVLLRPWQRWAFYVALSFATAAGTTYAFLATFQCGLPTKLFQNIIHDKCLPRSVNLGFSYMYSITNIIADLTFVLIPIWMLRNSQMGRRAKISVTFVISLGATSSVASMIRLKFINGSVFGPDFFQNASNLAFWSTIEPGIGIVAGSLATLRPLLRAAISLACHGISNTVSGSRSQSGHNKGYSRYGSEQLRMSTFKQAHAPDGSQPFDDNDKRNSYTANISGGKAALSPPFPPKNAMFSFSSTKQLKRYNNHFNSNDSTASSIHSLRDSKARHHRRYVSLTDSSDRVGSKYSKMMRPGYRSSVAVPKTNLSLRHPRHYPKRYGSSSSARGPSPGNLRRHQQGRHQRYQSDSTAASNTSLDGWTHSMSTVNSDRSIRKVVEVAITREINTEGIGRHRANRSPSGETNAIGSKGVHEYIA